MTATAPAPGALVTWEDYDEYRELRPQRQVLGVLIGYDDRGAAVLLPLGEAEHLTRRDVTALTAVHDPGAVAVAAPAPAPAPVAPVPVVAPVNVLQNVTPAAPVDVLPTLTAAPVYPAPAPAPAVVTSPLGVTAAPVVPVDAVPAALPPVPTTPMGRLLAPAMSPTAAAAVQ